jgi:DNA polymerase III epsilon subunit-like protein
MKVLVFDTETTGLPTERNASIYSTEKWPHIIQLSFMVYNTDTNEITADKDYIINIGSNVALSEESVNIHGITREMSMKKGIHIKHAFRSFRQHLRYADMIVAHNISFDKRMVMVESIRNKLFAFDSIFNHASIQSYCTMRCGSDLCKIQAISQSGEKYFKYPKLIELHEHLFKTIPNNAHNAKVDIIICLRCFYKMKFNKDLCRINRDFRMLYRNNC